MKYGAAQPQALVQRAAELGQSIIGLTDRDGLYGAVRWASRERRRDALDKLIAAHALALDVALVTNNPRDFASYPDLRIENWVE